MQFVAFFGKKIIWYFQTKYSNLWDRSCFVFGCQGFTTAYDIYEEFPNASKVILKNFYMDDVLTGDDNMAAAKQI